MASVEELKDRHSSCQKGYSMTRLMSTSSRAFAASNTRSPAPFFTFITQSSFHYFLRRAVHQIPSCPILPVMKLERLTRISPTTDWKSPAAAA